MDANEASTLRVGERVNYAWARTLASGANRLEIDTGTIEARSPSSIGIRWFGTGSISWHAPEDLEFVARDRAPRGLVTEASLFHREAV